MAKYEIKSYKQETSCDWCGYPFYVGDYAYLDENTNRVYCGEKCQKKNVEKMKKRKEKRKCKDLN